MPNYNKPTDVHCVYDHKKRKFQMISIKK